MAVAEGLLNLFKGVGDLAKAATAKVTKYMAYRRIYQTLNEMTDRELDDIGLCRGDIDMVARGHDPRPRREAYLAAALAQRGVTPASFADKTVDQGANDNQTVEAA
ncbi:MAG TPA: DUF1127 domain-containing protein [Kiloniellaceae bacterium]|nr:DUF1127 domain-containing protein [Kiloniellaceae bacterium]